MTLKVENLTTYHGRIRAIEQINFHVDEGEIVSIIGANGAGKSTLLGTIAGIYRPVSGNVSLDDLTISKLPAHQVVRNGVSLVPEGRQVFSSLSVKENLILGMYYKYGKERGMVKEKIDNMMELFPGLKKYINTTAGNLSGGEQQMIAIARSLMSDPKVILLDEPSMGLAPLIVKEILGIMQHIKEQLGTKVVLVEQNIKAALSIADRAYVMDQGKIVLSGKAQELMNDPVIKETYLGYASQKKGAI